MYHIWQNCGFLPKLWKNALDYLWLTVCVIWSSRAGLGGRRLVERAEERKLLTPNMIRAARALAGMDQSRLATLANVDRRTIVTIENAGASTRKVDARRRAVLERIRKVFEDCGIRFTFSNEGVGWKTR